MKRLKLSKELFFGSVLIGALSIGLASCGGGGGGGGTGSVGVSGGGTGGGVSTSQPSGGSTPQSNLSFGSYIYQGKDYPNEPIITVYIDGQSVQLLADTGESGLVVNQSAVNIPSSDYTSYSFYGQYADGSSYTGVMASVTVCLNLSMTNSCVVMPIGVITSGNAFPSSYEAQGDLGLASGEGQDNLGQYNSQDVGTNSLGNSLYGYSYPTYLAQEYGINSFTISFYPLSNTFYAYVSSSTPIGEISFGTNAPSNYLPYYVDSPIFPIGTQVSFSSYTSSIPYLATQAIFDTGANFNFLTTDVFQTAIANFSPSSDENNCLSSVMQITMNGASSTGSVVNGGFPITYRIPYNSNSSTTTYYTTSFTTEPPSWFCSSNPQWNVMMGNTVDIGIPSTSIGAYSTVGQEDFGLPAMLGHTFVWVLDYSGFVQGISISP